jgi:hypothetical protein
MGLLFPTGARSRSETLLLLRLRLKVSAPSGSSSITLLESDKRGVASELIDRTIGVRDDQLKYVVQENIH